MLVTTKYFGPTNHKGSRIKATAKRVSKSVTIPYPYELDAREAHQTALAELCTRNNWPLSEWITEPNENGTGYVFIRPNWMPNND